MNLTEEQGGILKHAGEGATAQEPGGLDEAKIREWAQAWGHWVSRTDLYSALQHALVDYLRQKADVQLLHALAAKAEQVVRDLAEQSGLLPPPHTVEVRMEDTTAHVVFRRSE